MSFTFYSCDHVEQMLSVGKCSSLQNWSNILWMHFEFQI